MSPEELKEATKEIDAVLDKIKKGEIKPSDQKNAERIESLGQPSTSQDSPSDASTPEMPQKQGRALKRRRESDDDADDQDIEKEEEDNTRAGSPTIVIPSGSNSTSSSPGSNKMHQDSVIDLTQQWL